MATSSAPAHGFQDAIMLNFVRVLACVPQAQRHSARIGLLQRSWLETRDVIAHLSEYHESGRFTDEQVELLEGLGREMDALQRSTMDLFADVDRDRYRTDIHKFLWGDSYLSPEWDAVRRQARLCFASLVAPAGHE
jgi:hypothetical protein